MKRISILLGLTICLSSIITQVNAQAELALGLKAGLNLAKLDQSGLDNKTGIHAGAFLLVKLTKIGIQPEIVMSRQGFQQPSSFGTLKTEINYINIPIILKLYTVAGINLQLGPQFGFVSSANADIPSTGSISSVDIKDSIKGSDFSLGLGVGWDLPFGLSIDGRYNLGLSKVNDGTTFSSDVKNQVFQISVGYKLLKFG